MWTGVGKFFTDLEVPTTGWSNEHNYLRRKRAGQRRTAGCVSSNYTRLLYRAPFRWVVYLGRISYGLYVFHLFALALMSGLSSIPVLGIPLNFERRLLLSFLLTVILAAASYKWLEQPFLRLKKRFSYTPVREAEARNDKDVGPVGPTFGDVAKQASPDS